MADDLDPAQAAAQGLGWVPKGHPLYGTQGYVGYTGGAGVGMSVDPSQYPTSTVPAPAQPTSAAPPTGNLTPEQAAAQGLGWVPQGHPLYGTPGYVGSTPQSGGAPPAGGTPGQPAQGQTTIPGQAQAASSYSNTPTAAPSPYTSNQGTQDVLRNSYLQRATQGTTIDTNDPNFRQQADAYAAAQERFRRNTIDDASQAAFAGGFRGSGAETLAERMANEAAGRNVGQFEAQLVGKELQSRRDEISDALSGLKGIISTDQAAGLQRELAALDAAIKRESLSQSGSLGGRELDIRENLGQGALNVDLMRALLQNQQFGQELGLNIGQSEMNYLLGLLR